MLIIESGVNILCSSGSVKESNDEYWEELGESYDAPIFPHLEGPLVESALPLTAAEGLKPSHTYQFREAKLLP